MLAENSICKRGKDPFNFIEFKFLLKRRKATWKMGGATIQRRQGKFFQKPTMVFIITIVWQRNIDVLIWNRNSKTKRCAWKSLPFFQVWYKLSTTLISINHALFGQKNTFEILSSSPMSETARPRRRFMKTRAMIMMKMRKKILAMKGVSCALVKFAVKSNSPISIANT